jgi:hypothetical protein
MVLVAQGTKEEEDSFIVLLRIFLFGKHFSYCCGHSSHVVARVAIFHKL